MARKARTKWKTTRTVTTVTRRTSLGVLPIIGIVTLPKLVALGAAFLLYRRAKASAQVKQAAVDLVNGKINPPDDGQTPAVPASAEMPDLPGVTTGGDVASSYSSGGGGYASSASAATAAPSARPVSSYTAPAYQRPGGTSSGGAAPTGTVSLPGALSKPAVRTTLLVGPATTKTGATAFTSPLRR